MSQSPTEGDLEHPLEMASMKSRFGSFKSTRGTAYSLRRGSSGTSSKKITCVVYLLEEKTQEWTLDVRRLGVWEGGVGIMWSGVSSASVVCCSMLLSIRTHM